MENSEVEAHISIVGFILVFFYAIAIAGLSVVGLVCLVQGITRPSLAASAVGILLSCLGGINIYFGTHFPFKVALRGSQLNARYLFYSLSVNLSELSYLSNYRTMNTNIGNRGIKCLDKTGNHLYLQLGLIPQKKRILFYEPLLRAFEQPQVSGDDRVIRTWNNWFWFRHFMVNDHD